MAPVQLIIFDCDGVLVDSEPDMRALPGLVALANARAAGAARLLVAVDVGTGSAPGRRRRPLPASAARQWPKSPARAASGARPATIAEHVPATRSGTRCAGRVRAADSARAGTSARRAVAGIGFDATCSLVVRRRRRVQPGQRSRALEAGPPGTPSPGWTTGRRRRPRKCNGGRASRCCATSRRPSCRRRWRRPSCSGLRAQPARKPGRGPGTSSTSPTSSPGSAIRVAGALAIDAGLQMDLVRPRRARLAARLPRRARARGHDRTRQAPERATAVGADLGPLLPAAAAELGLTTRCRVGPALWTPMPEPSVRSAAVPPTPGPSTATWRWSAARRAACSRCRAIRGRSRV